MQSALTGHMVLSSLHATDGPGALLRFIDMGIEGFLIASSVISIVAQRLVRKVCDGCKTTTLYAALHELDQQVRNIMTIEDPVEYTFDNINQSQINKLADISFANGLRAIRSDMRHGVWWRRPWPILLRHPETSIDAAQIGQAAFAVNAIGESSRQSSRSAPAPRRRQTRSRRD